MSAMCPMTTLELILMRIPWEVPSVACETELMLNEMNFNQSREAPGGVSQ
jgi:hypothetical protein